MPTVVLPEDVLNDLCSRFLLTLPANDQSSTSEPATGQVDMYAMRVCYQLELAHWFYIDFELTNNPNLPSLNFADFSFRLLKHVKSFDYLAPQIDSLARDWRAFKAQVPTYGCVILDCSFRYCLLVQGFSSKESWGFPKGKINAGEEGSVCALREVQEEVGLDCSPDILTQHFIDGKMSGRQARLYFVVNVPFDTHFEAKCRGEIKEIKWFPVEGLPKHKTDMTSQMALGMHPSQFFMVIPFVREISDWIDTHRDQYQINPTPKQEGVKKKQRAKNNSPLSDKVTQSNIKHTPVANKPKVAVVTPNVAKNRTVTAPASNEKVVDSSKKSKIVPVENKSGEFVFSSPVLSGFRLDIARVMMAWDGWPRFP